MKKAIVIYTLIPFLYACVFDPPITGKEIIIENQSANYVYVSDCLTKSKPVLYDSFYVNNKIYIGRKGNYIPKYSKWSYFLPNKKSIELSKEKQDLNLFFFAEEFLNNDSVNIKNISYKKISINVNEIETQPLNYIFYDGSNVKLCHEFDLRNKSH